MSQTNLRIPLAAFIFHCYIPCKRYRPHMKCFPGTSQVHGTKGAKTQQVPKTQQETKSPKSAAEQVASTFSVLSAHESAQAGHDKTSRAMT